MAGRPWRCFASARRARGTGTPHRGSTGTTPWGPTAQTRRETALGERWPSPAPRATRSPPGGANRAARAPAGRIGRSRQTPGGRTVHTAGPVGPWTRQMGRPPRRRRASWEGRVRLPPSLQLALGRRGKPRARRNARTNATHALGWPRSAAEVVSSWHSMVSVRLGRGGGLSHGASPGQRPWARRRPGEGPVVSSQGAYERLKTPPRNSGECGTAHHEA